LGVRLASTHGRDLSVWPKGGLEPWAVSSMAAAHRSDIEEVVGGGYGDPGSSSVSRRRMSRGTESGGKASVGWRKFVDGGAEFLRMRWGMGGGCEANRSRCMKSIRERGVEGFGYRAGIASRWPVWEDFVDGRCARGAFESWATRGRGLARCSLEVEHVPRCR